MTKSLMFAAIALSIVLAPGLAAAKGSHSLKAPKAPKAEVTKAPAAKPAFGKKA